MTGWQTRFSEAIKEARAAIASAEAEIALADNWTDEFGKLTGAMIETGVLRSLIDAECAKFKPAGPVTDPQAFDALSCVHECRGKPGFGDAVAAFCSIALSENWTAAAINDALAPYDLKMESR